MLHFEFEAPSLDDIDAQMRAIASFRPDFEAIEPRVREIVQDENRRQRLAGLDVNDDPLAPIAESTVKRRRQKGDGDGPPLAPNGAQSRVVRNYVVSTETGPGRLRVRAGHVGMPWLERHRGGSGHLPKRDVMSHIPPEAIEQVNALIVAESDRQLAEILSGANRGFFGRAFDRVRNLFGGR